MVTHSVKGSEPTFSCEATPTVEVTGPGTVTGIVVPHVLPFVETVTLTIVVPVESRLYLMLGLHWSRVWRATKAAPRSSCFLVIIGHVTLR